MTPACVGHFAARGGVGVLCGMIQNMAETMTLQINGESRSVPHVDNIHDLLQRLGVGKDRIAVELNRKIVHRSEWGETALADMDRVEIVQFVGGG